MCPECWNAAMAAPLVAGATRFAWVGYRDRIPFVRRRDPVESGDRVESINAPAEVRAAEPVG